MTSTRSFTVLSPSSNHTASSAYQPDRYLWSSNSIFFSTLLCLFRLPLRKYYDFMVAISSLYFCWPGFDSRQKQSFSVIHIIQTGPGAHPASYPLGTGDSFPWVKRTERETDHPPPYSAEVNNGGTISALLHMPPLHSA
jgi:hypothetical protein